VILSLMPMQVRLAALKREEDALQRERETLEAAKLAHIKCASMPDMNRPGRTSAHLALLRVGRLAVPVARASSRDLHRNACSREVPFAVQVDRASVCLECTHVALLCVDDQTGPPVAVPPST
jgi:hypothetical protein